MPFLENLRSSLRRRLQAGKWICTGFGNNLDLETVWDGKAVARMAVESWARISDRPGTAPAAIGSTADLTAALGHHFLTGEGGEIPLTESSLVPFIRRRFRHSLSVGGTGIRAACSLAHLGFPALAHLDVLSSAVLRELEPFGVSTIRGEYAVRVDSRLQPEADDDAPHFIFQFREGDTLAIGGRRFSCPGPTA
jgi:ADP-dependent phosphofructokinase/glucokinase